MPPQPKPRPVAEPEQLAALTNALARLAGADPALLKFGVAVSGGPDSVALLLLLNAIQHGGLAVATVDHGLRPESAVEADDVARLCRRFELRHDILRGDSPLTGSIQAEARALRYRLLEKWRAARGLDYVLTAHHADDQAETLLMRLNRASGVAGLSAIRARNGRILRPLLGWRHETLLNICRSAGVLVVDDPSNHDPRFDRARMRRQINEASWIDVAALARSADLLAGADEALDWAAGQAEQTDDLATIIDGNWPDEIAWRVMRNHLFRFAGQGIGDQRQLLDAVAALRAGRKVSLGPLIITPDPKVGTCWRIMRAPPRRG